MEWYYIKGADRVGPLADADFTSRIQQGEIAADTLVWNPSLKDWIAYGKLNGGTPADGTAVCTICRRTVRADDVVQYENATVCANCKPAFVQQLREGSARTAEMAFAGFWIRFGAVFVDGIILGVCNFVLSFVVTAAAAAASPEAAIAVTLVLYAVQIAIQAAYEIVMVGKYGATLGKMVFKLKVVTPEGGQVSYLRATGRHFSKYVSYLTLYIGFIMAGFDKEKRALHDYMCGTRVVRT
jgi:uncharacterized RDD family membrane protein YckC